MKITDHVYQVSGNAYGMNSNVFALEAGDEIVLIDSGNYRRQYDQIIKMMNDWKLDPMKIKAVLITHAHMDHIGGAHFFQDQGAEIIISENDADVLENGGPSALENLFGSKLTTCKGVTRVNDGDVLRFGEWSVRVMELPGHTDGTVCFLAEDGRRSILFAGDMFLIGGTTPNDEVLPQLGWTGGPDYDGAKNLASFEKLKGLKVDIIAPGHAGVYFGDSIEVFEKLYILAKEDYEGKR